MAQWQYCHDGRCAAFNCHGIYRFSQGEMLQLHILRIGMVILPRVTMVCLLIAHGIFPRQEASQSSRAIMKSPQPAAAHFSRARSGAVVFLVQVPAAPSRVCEAAHGRRGRLKLRRPWRLVSSPSPPDRHHRAVDCLISLISHAGPHLPLVIHTSTALHHHSLWCFATILPFIVPGPAVTLSGTLRLLAYHSLSSATSTPRRVNDPSILLPLAPSQQPYYTFNPPPGCWTPVLDTALISPLPTTSSSSRLSFGPNYRCLAHS